MYKIFFYGHFTTLISTKFLFESILNKGKSEIRQKYGPSESVDEKKKISRLLRCEKIFNHEGWKASQISTLLRKISKKYQAHRR